MNCLKCAAKPTLVLTTPEKPETFTPIGKIYCRGCGYLFKELTPNKILWGCKSCSDYFVCTNCKLCKQGHALFKCYNLTKKGSGGGTYLSNKYSCDVCSLTTDAVKKGQAFVWHCNPCQFDACPHHFTTGHGEFKCDAKKGAPEIE